VKLSLSVRIVEAACKTRLHLPFADLVSIAKDTGYSAVCLRASAAGVQSPLAEIEAMRRITEEAQLTIAMVTADFDVPLNNANGPDSLRNIRPSLDVAEAAGCDLIRVCLKNDNDIEHATRAAELAGERGIRLAHQCHTSSIFEEVDEMLNVLARIGCDNFGLIYEPANLMLCGQSYWTDTLQKLRPHLMNAYVQNHRLDDAGPESLPTYCRGDVRFHHLDPWESGGVDFQKVFDSLHAVDYDGFFTIHQAQGIETYDAAHAFAARCAEWALPHMTR